MKKVRIGAIAALVAIAGVTAVKASNLARINYFWFLKSAGHYSYAQQSANAPSSCSAGAVTCARAYTAAQVTLKAGVYTIKAGQTLLSKLTAFKPF